MTITDHQAAFGPKLDAAIATITEMLNDGKREWREITREIGRVHDNLKALKESHEKLTARVYQIENWQRKPFSRATVKVFTEVVFKYFGGMCPCCGEHPILNRTGVKNGNFEIDHFKGAKWNKITEGWTICRHCHNKITHGYLSRDGGFVEQAFKGFQMRVRQYTAAADGESSQLDLF